MPFVWLLLLSPLIDEFNEASFRYDKFDFGFNRRSHRHFSSRSEQAVNILFFEAEQAVNVLFFRSRASRQHFIFQTEESVDFLFFNDFSLLD
jgi:hypothetical protein